MQGGRIMNFTLSLGATSIFFALLTTSCGVHESGRLSPEEKLPTEFSDYKYIDEITEFENYTVEKFKVPPRSTVEHSLNKTTNNIIIEIATDVDDHTRQHTFYKLNTSGNIIDSHQFSRSFLIAKKTGDEQLVGGTFLVNKENSYYSTWPLNGDKTKRPFTPINQDLAWSTEQVDAYYKEITKKSARLDDVETYEKISAHENKRRIRKVYYLNTTGKWYVLYGNSLTSDFSGKRLSGINTLFKDFTDVERGFGRYTPPSNITIPYFEKQTYSKYCAQNAGSSGCSMNYTWEGIGYYQVTIADVIFKFKNKGSLSRSDFKGTAFPPKETLLNNFAYYTMPALTYSLFSANEELYLIKHK
jgi:hypothetical protein